MQDNIKNESSTNTSLPEKPTFLKIVFEKAGCGTYGTIVALIVCIPLCFVSEAFVYFSILLGVWTLFWMILHFLDYRSQLSFYKTQISECENSGEDNEYKRAATKKILLVLIIVVILAFVFWCIHFFNQSSDTTNTTKPETISHTYTTTSRNYTTATRTTTRTYEPTPVSQRCWYCGKVIFSDGRAIHATHKYLETYECDYCGKSNVKE